MRKLMLSLALGVLATSCTGNSYDPASQSSAANTSSGAQLSSGSNGAVPGKAVRMGYIQVNDDDALLSKVNWANFTHIGVFSVNPTANGEIYRVKGSLASTSAIWWPQSLLRSKYLPVFKSLGIKTLLVVGGAGYTSQLKTACLNPASRAEMVLQLSELVNGTAVDETGSYADVAFDGIDLDWEYPNGATSVECFKNLVLELRAAMPGKLLTAAVVPGPISNYSPDVVKDQLDWIGLMTYDLTPEGAQTDHSPYGKTVGYVTNWVSAGVPVNKLLIGVALYGDMSLASSIPWRLAINDLAKNQKYFSPVDSNLAKVNLINSAGLAGVMYWEVQQDDYATDYSITGFFDKQLKALGK